MLKTTSLDGAWVAVQVRANHEDIVAEQLVLRGYESFAPSSRLPSVVGEHRRPQKTPLFPGYLFCRYRPSHEHKIVEASSVIRIVGICGIPVAIPDEEISAIRTIVKSSIETEPWPTLGLGQRVRVCRGPLAGTLGTLVEAKNRTRLIIGVALLHKYIAVEVAVTDVAEN